MKIRLVWAAGLILFANITGLRAQEWEKEVKDPSNFYNLQKTFYEEEVEGREVKEEDGPNEIYERWAHFMVPRVYPDGKPFAPDIIYKEWNKYLQSHSVSYLSKKASWEYAGPKTAPSLGGGSGRINCVRVQPGNNKMLWAGTPNGGLWRSTDGGQSWGTNTDLLPNLGVTDIAFNPIHPDTMYIATGDGFGYVYNNGVFWGGTYSSGVLKSTDGGWTFSPTGMNWDFTQARQIYRLFVHPKNPNLIIASTNNGIWKSTDAGAHWKQTLTGVCNDMEINPYNPSVLYTGTGGTNIYYSKDTGNTWTAGKTNFGSTTFSGIELAVSPAAPNSVYALTLTYYIGYLYKSTNQGKTWTFITTVNNTFYGMYSRAMAASPTDSNHLFIGGLNIIESKDGGYNWSGITSSVYGGASYVHPDHRAFTFLPGTEDTLFNGNDGGVYMGVKKSGTYKWTMISNDIHTLQFYRLGSSMSKPGTFFAGAQDNGINRGVDGTWDHVVLGDGMEAMVAYDNPNVVYANTQYGFMHKSTNGGKDFTTNPSIGPSGSFNWITPMLIDPHNSKVLYYGGNELYKSVNSGSSWKMYRVDTKNNNNIGLLSLCNNNTNYIYAVKESDVTPNTVAIYRTTDGGNNWKDISTGLPTGTVYVSGVAADVIDSQKVWVTFSGFRGGEKVYLSTDGGDTWKNMSGSLPNIPVNCVTVENSAENGVYIGTDIGVFYRSDSDTDWVRYSDGLPNVMIDEMEIIPATNKLRVATYGRGIWETDLSGTLNAIDRMEAVEKEINLYPNPSTGAFHIELPEIVSKVAKIHIYNMQGKEVKELEVSPASADNINIEMSNYSSGLYTLIVDVNGVRVSKKVLIQK